MTASDVFPASLTAGQSTITNALEETIGEIDHRLTSEGELDQILASNEGADLHGALHQRLIEAKERIVHDFIEVKSEADRPIGYDVNTVSDNADLALEQLLSEWAYEFFRHADLSSSEITAEALLGQHIGQDERSLRYDDLFRQAAERAAQNRRFAESINSTE